MKPNIIYLSYDVPSCPGIITVPECFAFNKDDNIIFIVPPENKRDYRDLPSKTIEYKDIDLENPLYHNGYVVMKSKHNGVASVKQITLSVFNIFGVMTIGQVFDTADDNEKLSMMSKYSFLIHYYPNSQVIENKYKKPYNAYIIHLASRPDRKKRMIERMNKHNFNYTIVDAIHYKNDNEFIRKMSEGADNINVGRIYNRDAQFACLYSHLKAIRTFYDSGEDIGFILEDDCTFHKRFDEWIDKVMFMLERKGEFNLCSLLVSNHEFYIQKRNVNGIHNPILLNLDDRAWGMVGYIITREYAKYCLDTFDKPICQCPSIPNIPNYVTSEIIPMYSKGVATSIALVMDELGPSTICENNDVIHRNMFSFHGLDNYDIPDEY